MDLTNQIHGKLVVVEKETDPSKLLRNGPTWFCLCECGKTCHVRTNQLTSGQARSCGCWTKSTQRKHDLTGQRFGMLTVITEIEKRICEKKGKKRGTKIQWSCQCDCGNITVGTTGSLRSGCKKSCGCLRGKKRRERAEKAESEARLKRKSAQKEPSSVLSDSWGFGDY